MGQNSTYLVKFKVPRRGLLILKMSHPPSGLCLKLRKERLVYSVLGLFMDSNTNILGRCFIFTQLRLTLNKFSFIFSQMVGSCDYKTCHLI